MKESCSMIQVPQKPCRPRPRAPPANPRPRTAFPVAIDVAVDDDVVVDVDFDVVVWFYLLKYVNTCLLQP